jgi:hypothetical protein
MHRASARLPASQTVESDLVRVVLGDANVLYPRVVRDYLLYAADQEGSVSRGAG